MGIINASEDNQTKLIKVAQEYDALVEQRDVRQQQWTNEKLDLIKSVLEEIAAELEQGANFFKGNIYADRTRLFSGNTQAALVGTEIGFQIIFRSLANFKVVAEVHGHGIAHENPDYKELAYIEDLDEITAERIRKLVIQGLEFAKETSFLFE